jgi:hypothetical protein
VNNIDLIDVLLVEDNPSDADMTLRALKRSHLANRIEWVKDGVKAIDYVLRRGRDAARDEPAGQRSREGHIIVFAPTTERAAPLHPDRCIRVQQSSRSGVGRLTTVAPD